MHKIAWKSLRKDGGMGRASINHFTSDGKKTLCNKPIPVTELCLDSKHDCKKCSAIKTRAEDYVKIMADKPAYFKEVVELLGGHYEPEGVAWWDNHGNKKDMYVAYGRLAPFMDNSDNFRMTDNALYYAKS
jgi:hypothetical protein